MSNPIRDWFEDPHASATFHPSAADLQALLNDAHEYGLFDEWEYIETHEVAVGDGDTEYERCAYSNPRLTVTQDDDGRLVIGVATTEERLLDDTHHDIVEERREAALGI